jgi:hypothetical protein
MHYVHNFAHSPVHAADSLVELDAGHSQTVTVSRCNCRSHSALVVEIAVRSDLGSRQESWSAGTAGGSWDAGKMKMVGEESDMAERVCWLCHTWDEKVADTAVLLC